MISVQREGGSFGAVLICFGSNKTKGPKQKNQNRLRSPMPEAGEP